MMNGEIGRASSENARDSWESDFYDATLYTEWNTRIKALCGSVGRWYIPVNVNELQDMLVIITKKKNWTV